LTNALAAEVTRFGEFVGALPVPVPPIETEPPDDPEEVVVVGDNEPVAPVVLVVEPPALTVDDDALEPTDATPV
jgi:hypothetical protein